MAISTTGRAIKVKTKAYVRSKNHLPEIINEYNHLRLQFSDGSERHMLFTNKEMTRAFKRASAKIRSKDKPKTTWIHEVWYEGVVELEKDEVKDIITNKNLPNIAKSFNHVRLNIDGSDLHLLFTKSDIRTALLRSSQLDIRLPKTSYIETDNLI